MTPAATERRPLGRTSSTVTRLGLGTASFGALFEPVADAAAEATIARAWELGLRFFDTAPLYGNGLAERRLGRVLAGLPRDAYTLATKVGRPRRTADGASVFDYSRDGVLRSLEASLERLGVDRVDVLHVHDADDHMEEALEHAVPTLAELRAQGVIGAVGAGMNQAPALARFAREADVDCLLLAGRFTLLDHTGARELLRLCEQREVALIVGGVYNSGILAGPAGRATFDYRPAPPELRERVDRLEAACAARDVPLMAAAIQFPFRAPAVASVLSGSRSVAELEQNVRMLGTPIPRRLWDDLRARELLVD
jgi:D-threo-aldose 1-dehydrogenase